MGVIIGFIILSLLYCYPALTGKTLLQTDMIQAKGSTQEIKVHKEKTGTYPLWTNSMFGGMPSYQIYLDYPSSVLSYVGRFIGYQMLPAPASLIFVYLLGFYLLMMVLGFDIGLSVLGAVAFGFASYNIISIEAGHISKVLALGFAPPFLASVVLTYRGKYLLGGALSGITASLQLYTNHIQITYYALIALGLYAVFALFWAIRQQTLKKYLTATMVLALVGIFALGSHASRLWTTYEFSSQTIRGKSELTTNEQSKGGLDRDYAFQWSYGIGETFTFLIPNFYGGSSNGSLGKKSETFKLLVSKGVPAENAADFTQQLPLYWGDQPFTGGPAYVGAIVFFLFLYSLIIVKDPIKWWLLTVTLLFTVLAWGKNFGAFNNLVFDYVPLYNKFRAVTMLLSVVQIFIVWMAVLGLQTLLHQLNTSAQPTGKGAKSSPTDNQNLLTPLYIVAGILAGFCLVLAGLGGSFFSFVGGGDGDFLKQLQQMAGPDLGKEIMAAIRSDRASMLQGDAFRSFVFIALTAALIWAFITQKIQATVFTTVLLLLLAADMIYLDASRYLRPEDYVAKSQAEARFEKTPADEQILKDKDPHYRVFNLAVNPFNDATTSYYHKSIGGYHGAKFRRYQELIDNQIRKNNRAVFDMLNVKYFIVPQQQQLVAQKNPTALGNAWFVENYQIVKNADEEMKGLDSLLPAQTALVDKRFESELAQVKGGIQFDKDNKIILTSYSPDVLKYSSKAKAAQLAVFSEIYYNHGLGWNAYVDGKKAPHFRVNYVLRAMVVPAGEHKIEFRFEPISYTIGEKLSLFCSLLLLAMGALAIVLQIRNQTDGQ